MWKFTGSLSDFPSWKKPAIYEEVRGTLENKLCHTVTPWPEVSRTPLFQPVGYLVPCLGLTLPGEVYLSHQEDSARAGIDDYSHL